MSNLISSQNSGGLAAPTPGSRLPAPTNRALGRIQHRAIVATARVQAQAWVGKEALFAVADLSELEGQLGSLCPLAVSRLEAIANMTTLGIAQTISGFRG